MSTAFDLESATTTETWYRIVYTDQHNTYTIERPDTEAMRHVAELFNDPRYTIATITPLEG